MPTPYRVRSGDNNPISLAKFKKHMRINAEDTSEDELLQKYLDAAKEDADLYCNNLFPDGIPAKVEQFVYARAGLYYEHRIDLVDGVAVPGVQSDTFKFEQERQTATLRRLRMNPGF